MGGFEDFRSRSTSKLQQRSLLQALVNINNSSFQGVDDLLRIPPSTLKQHNKRDDAWTAVYGKVYNITAYLPFHPGGVNELMRAAGRDGTKLFGLYYFINPPLKNRSHVLMIATTHGWVNVDFMLDACLVGFLVPEPSIGSAEDE